MPSCTNGEGSGNGNNCFTPWPDMGQAMRVYSDDGPSPTIANHHVLVLHEVGMDEDLFIFQQNQRNEVRILPGVAGSLLSASGMKNTNYVVQRRVGRVVPIQDGREMEKKQNGFGIGEVGDPMYTLDTTGAQAVAYEEGSTDEP